MDFQEKYFSYLEEVNSGKRTVPIADDVMLDIIEQCHLYETDKKVINITSLWQFLLNLTNCNLSKGAMDAICQAIEGVSPDIDVEAETSKYLYSKDAPLVHYTIVGILCRKEKMLDEEENIRLDEIISQLDEVKHDEDDSVMNFYKHVRDTFTC